MSLSILSSFSVVQRLASARAATAVSLTAAALLLSPCSNAPGATLRENVLRFDAGPAASELSPDARALDRGSVYTPRIGFGWTAPPRRAFVRRDLRRSRDAATIDGVAGKRIGCRFDVAPGIWHVSLLLEGESAGGNQIEIRLQGRPLQSGLSQFLPAESAQAAQRKTYRLVTARAEVDKGGLLLSLDADHVDSSGEVGLLAMSLIRHVGPTTATHRELLKAVKVAGAHDNRSPLEVLVAKCDSLLKVNHDDAFAAYWRGQLEFLDLADRYYQMRGWEDGKQQTGLGMFTRLYLSGMLLDGLLHRRPHPADHPLWERALFLRGRLLFWLGKEHGAAATIADGQQDLLRLHKLHPNNRLLAMYVGKQVDSPDQCDCLASADGAPPWSVLQHEALCRLRAITHWWVEHRQASNGELGGKLADDVELLRWWEPLVLVGDRVAQRGWRKLADGVWESDQLHDGYARDVRDVEHAAELIADTAPLMSVFHDNPRFVDRLTPSARHFEQLWTGVSARGRRHFRSAWFSSTAVRPNEPMGRDVEYNNRAVKALRFLAWRRKDPRVVRLLHEWSLAWVDAALRTDKQKPAGLIPASIRFTDLAFNGDESTWYRANMIWPYYDWEQSNGCRMLDQLFFTYTLTGDARLLEPMFLTLELIENEQPNFEGKPADRPAEGSCAWAADILARSPSFWEVVEQWRFRSQDPRWDALILRYGSDYAKFRLSGDETHLVRGLDSLLTAVRFNTPLLTNEVLHTDRVQIAGAGHLKAMLTGDGRCPSWSPHYAATWENTADEFTALIDEAGIDVFAVQLYSHARQASHVNMRLWQLTPGDYRLTVEADGRVTRQTLKLKERGQRVEFALPGECVVRVRIAAEN